MSESTTILLKEVKKLKTGSNNKGQWTLYGLIDGNEEVFGTWFNDTDLYNEARRYENEKAEVEFEKTDKGRNVKSIGKPATNGDTPPLGTGEYVTGQKPPIEVRRIYASTAWNCAARMAQADLGFAAAHHIADQIFLDLLKKGKAIEDEDIPF